MTHSLFKPDKPELKIEDRRFVDVASLCYFYDLFLK